MGCIIKKQGSSYKEISQNVKHTQVAPFESLPNQTNYLEQINHNESFVRINQDKDFAPNEKNLVKDAKVPKEVRQFLPATRPYHGQFTSFDMKDIKNDFGAEVIN